MKKAEALARWRGLEPDQPIMDKMPTIPYKTEGKKYGAGGIRIDGPPEFVDAVLSHLKEVLAGENSLTRLGLSRRPANTDFKSNPNAAADAEVCYIRLHERGREAKICRTMFGSPEGQATLIEED